MNDKFTMNLVWHNCKTYPPKEEFNDSLIITNGYIVIPIAWYANEYHTLEGNFSQEYSYDLDNWWWADIELTVRGESRFRDR